MLSPIMITYLCTVRSLAMQFHLVRNYAAAYEYWMAQQEHVSLQTKKAS